MNKEGIALVKKFEGCRLIAYTDPVGVWTIGYGHTVNVTPGMVITQAQADELLKQDLEKFENGVKKLINVPVNENQISALVSFSYNVGLDKLRGSTLLKKLNAKDYEGAANEFPKWNKAGEKVLNGLVKRREAEKELFLSGTTTNVKGGEDMVKTFSVKANGNDNISANFKVKEFKCKDGSDEILIDVDFVKNYLQKIRDHFKAPITINSAYRTPAYNKKIGGATNSYHMKGRAFDIAVKGYSPSEVAEYALKLKIKGIIKYNTFVHVDSRDNVYHAINNGKTATTVNNFL